MPWLAPVLTPVRAVTLITGPVSLSPLSRVNMVPVNSALEMHDAAVHCALGRRYFYRCGGSV